MHLIDLAYVCVELRVNENGMAYTRSMQLQKSLVVESSWGVVLMEVLYLSDAPTNHLVVPFAGAATILRPLTLSLAIYQDHWRGLSCSR